MPWIELHHTLREHPKTASLVEAMGFADADHAVGKLTRLWLWVLEYAPDGNLDHLSVAQLAVAAGVDPTDGNRWLAALRSARWLDSEPRLRIHDWWDYVGYFLQKKWDKKPERWKAVRDAYGAAAPDCGAATSPQRLRNVSAAEPQRTPCVAAYQPTSTNQPTGGGTRARDRGGERRRQGRGRGSLRAGGHSP